VTTLDTGSGAELADSRPQQPRALIVTLYGLYAREVGGWLGVATLVRLLGELGVDEPAVRSSISRLKRRGILEGARVGGAAGYALSDRARAILDDGDRRIFERHRGSLEAGWLLAIFSVPESEREKRHTLRSRLSWLGFGTAASGVWIAPGHLDAETRDVLGRYALSPYVDLFRADYLAFGDVRAQVAQWWDLERLQGLYGEFLNAFKPVRTDWRRRRAPADAAAFSDYVRALTAWRRLPYLDPGLPGEVLPPTWHGARAADLFFELHDRLAQPAHRHVDAVRHGPDLDRRIPTAGP